MTHPTKAIMRMLLLDYVRRHQDEVLYSEDDLEACLRKCEVVDTHQTLEVRGIRFKAYTAGHVLGACMFMVELGGVHVLYTGDYSTEEDRHLMGAEVPSLSPDVLICESTFGVMEHPGREDREQRFTAAVEKVVSEQRGCCLIPVFALGRAQELLLILDEYWAAHHHLQEVATAPRSPGTLYLCGGKRAVAKRAVSRLARPQPTTNRCRMAVARCRCTTRVGCPLRPCAYTAPT